jgi:hypothetical protein
MKKPKTKEEKALRIRYDELKRYARRDNPKTKERMSQNDILNGMIKRRQELRSERSWEYKIKGRNYKHAMENESDHDVFECLERASETCLEVGRAWYKSITNEIKILESWKSGGSDKPKVDAMPKGKQGQYRLF